jgi:hypothetical protein
MKIIDNQNLHNKKVFPELPDDFPDELLSEEWALRIHGQTLKRLNERGGLSVHELLMNLKRMTIRQFDNTFKGGVTKYEVDELLSYINEVK